MDKRAEIREKALKDLQQSEVLMLDGHFDYGNGYHGRVYLNPHQLFRHPSTIWRFAQDLLDLLPGELVQRTEVVAGPVTGGALLAHTIAGLLDSRRSLTHPPCSFAPFNYDRRRRVRAARRSIARELERQARAARRRCAEHGRDVRALRRARRTRRAARWSRRSEIYDRCEATSTSACRTSRWPNTRRRRTTKPPTARCAAQDMPITRF